MTSFSQLGDPVCAACLCEHHGAAYAEFETTNNYSQAYIYHEYAAAHTTIISVPITITERCCVVVNAATLTDYTTTGADISIERPLGTIRTAQSDQIGISDLNLLHHAAWEVLNPGAYTYFLVNSSSSQHQIMGAWIKAIASDCEG